MSIATEIERIQNAKASIKTAIENKGIEVGDGLIDTYASKIDEISTGVELTDLSWLFYNNARLDIKDKLFEMCKGATKLEGTFSGCTSLTSLDLNNLNISNDLSTVKGMFEDCNKLTNLTLCDLSNAKPTDFSYMFSECRLLKDIDLSKFDTSNVTSMEAMFNQCRDLTSLDLSKFDTSKVNSFASMFYYCRYITSLDLSNFDTSNANSFYRMFMLCNALKDVDVSSFDISNAWSIEQMFQNCKAITTLDLSNFDASRVENVNNLFFGCTNLTNLTFMNNLGKGYYEVMDNYDLYEVYLRNSTKLTHDSLMDVINKLYDLNVSYEMEGYTFVQTLNIGATNLAKLTSEEIAIATSKGWVVS